MKRGTLHGSELPTADCNIFPMHVTLLALVLGALLSWEGTASSVRQSGFMRTKNNVQCTASLPACAVSDSCRLQGDFHLRLRLNTFILKCRLSEIRFIQP